MTNISSESPFSMGDIPQAHENINNLFGFREFSNLQLLDDISSNRTSFIMPTDPEEKEYFLKLFKKLLSRPLSKRLVQEIANSGKAVQVENGLNHQFIQKRWDVPIELIRWKPLTKRFVQINKRNEGMEQRFAVIVNRAEHYFFDHWRKPRTLEFSPTYISFAHELIHAYHSIQNKLLSHLPANEIVYTNLEEENTIKGVPGYADYTENAIRAEFGLRERYSHQGALARLDHRRGPGKVMLV